MKKTRNRIECPPKIVKIAPHTYCISGGGYRTMRDILAFNKKINNETCRNKWNLGD